MARDGGARLPTGAILCGGKSRRMGRAKAGIRLADGRALIERVAGALGAVCARLVLVGEAEGVPPALDDLARIADRTPGLGPIGGIEALLASGLDAEYLIAPCDLPLAVPDLFRLLLAPDVAAPAVLFDPARGRLEPAIARYGADLQPTVLALIEEGERHIRAIAERCGARRVAVPETLRFALWNVNTPEDLRRAEAHAPPDAAPAGG